jgi:mannose-6-phosphate isomerase-like protein (cupin superfamily)
MIRRNDQYRCEVREEMRGGDGKVKIEHFWDKDELKSNNRLFARLTLEPGSSIGSHEHTGEEEVFVVVQGRAEADDNGEIVILETGDTILTSNACHSIKSIGDKPLVLVAVISMFG